ncbi:MAG TPA: PASTA domain-containing protein [Deltaproteobacteria bacterium]|nr:PASTA domain-containing protein [Deltaproteobacteria bacterium]
MKNAFRIIIVPYLLMFLCLALLSSCSGSSDSTAGAPHDTGSIAFSLMLSPDASAQQQRYKAPVLNCVELGIVSVEAEVYDDTETLIARGGPWECSLGEGLIPGVKRGKNRTVTVFLKNDSGIVRYRGEKSEVRVFARKTTDVGIIILVDAEEEDNRPPVDVEVPAASNCDDLEAVGLVCSVAQECSNTVPEGEVISQSPTAGTVVAYGSTVSLVISTGLCDVVVPAAESCADLEAVGLVCSVVQVCSNTVPEGEVISQSPTAGTVVPYGSTVQLVISTGLCPVLVPDVVDMAEADAITAINDAGLVPEVVYAVTGQSKGYVYSQSPEAGDEVHPGSIVVITVSDNNPPVANAGTDLAAVLQGMYRLNGSRSFDVDGDPITFLWIVINEPSIGAAELEGDTSVRPFLTISEDGTYEIELVVNDGSVDSSPDTVTITTSENVRPVAHAGSDIPGAKNVEVCLDGSLSSDPNGDDITYLWTIVSKPYGSLTELNVNDVEDPCLTPDTPGEYIVQLIVNDGSLDSEPDTVVVGVGVNLPPVAYAGGDRNVAIDDNLDSVCLSGAGSYDPDGNELIFSWSMLSAPATSIAELDDAYVVDPCFIPDLSGDYVIQLIVSDGILYSEPSTVRITAAVLGDLNYDGSVDEKDYTIFMATLGKCEGDTGYNAEADYDGDRCITYEDYRIWYGFYSNQ